MAKEATGVLCTFHLASPVGTILPNHTILSKQGNSHWHNPLRFFRFNQLYMCVDICVYVISSYSLQVFTTMHKMGNCTISTKPLHFTPL